MTQSGISTDAAFKGSILAIDHCFFSVTDDDMPLVAVQSPSRRARTHTTGKGLFYPQPDASNTPCFREVMTLKAAKTSLAYSEAMDVYEI